MREGKRQTDIQRQTQKETHSDRRTQTGVIVQRHTDRVFLLVYADSLDTTPTLGLLPRLGLYWRNYFGEMMKHSIKNTTVPAVTSINGISLMRCRCH